MEWILAIIFGAAFAIAGDESLLQFAAGAVLGFLLARVISLNSRIRFLEEARKVDQAQRRTVENTQRHSADARRSRETAAESDTSAALDDARQLEPKTATPREAPRAPSISPAPSPRSAAAAISPSATRTEAHTRSVRNSQPASAPSRDWRDIPAVRWLLKGNIPVKVGVLVSFFGVAFLLKHAVDQGWMSMPVELRLAGVAAFGVGLLWFGWRLKESHRIYALSIQGGGIGVLYLTTYTALRLFHVLPAGIAFSILVALAAGAGWLAVKQNARQLAVLGAVGGFIAPLLASTGTGSHVALFGYYLVLNLGIAGVALYRHWRMLNLLGFVFTFGIGLAWGAQYYQPRYFATVEPFLVAHFLLYTAVAILSALKQPFRLRGYVDSALVFGLPLVAFPLQAGLVDGESLPLAWTATVGAIFYAALAWWLYHWKPEVLRLLSQVYAALAVIFATLAVPLWLDSPWVANTWALEAAAMIAIGLKQRRALTHWAGVGLLLVAGSAYLVSLETLTELPPLLNERFIGAIVLCAAFSFCAWIYAQHEEVSKEIPMDWFTVTAAWAGWFIAGSAEIFEHAPGDWKASGGLAFAAILVFVLAKASRRWVPRGTMFAVSILPLMAVYWIAWVIEEKHLLAVHGWLAWPLAFAALAWVVHRLPEQRRWMLSGASWLAAAWLAVEIDYLVDATGISGQDWDSAAVALSLAGFVLLVRAQVSRIYAAHFQPVVALLPIIGILLAYNVLWSASAAGDFSPLPYLPVVNVMFIVNAVALVLAYRYTQEIIERRHRIGAAAVIGLLFITLEIARGTHHFAGTPFAIDPMWRSGVFQAALSITWSALGIAGMVLGARRAQRMLWLAGASIMGMIVVKLFIVDLGNTGSVTRIISFIGVGLLLLAVGYLAPAPTTGSVQQR